jgi:hypothetical protein
MGVYLETLRLRPTAAKSIDKMHVFQVHRLVLTLAQTEYSTMQLLF